MCGGKNTYGDTSQVFVSQWNIENVSRHDSHMYKSITIPSNDRHGTVGVMESTYFL